jgi:predicted Zn-ribbon and HTH transcriptional regulator
MAYIQRVVCKCDVCGHEWLAESVKEPARCPRRTCRSSLWNAADVREPAAPQEVAEIEMA